MCKKNYFEQKLLSFTKIKNDHQKNAYKVHG